MYNNIIKCLNDIVNNTSFHNVKSLNHCYLYNASNSPSNVILEANDNTFNFNNMIEKIKSIKCKRLFIDYKYTNVFIANEVMNNNNIKEFYIINGLNKLIEFKTYMRNYE